MRDFAASMNKWDPFRDLLSIQERVNRLFENAQGTVRITGDTASAGTWSPAVDICETEGEFLVKAEIPGVEQPDIDIRVRENILTIEGERKLHHTVMEGYHRIERVYGRFQRSFLLPVSVDQDGITASLKDGILRIVLPKKGETEKRHVKVAE